jgi:hypothetical protein
METPGGKKFSTPEEEIAYLRREIAAREQALLARNKEVDAADIETVGKEVIREYGEHLPEVVLNKKHQFDAHTIAHTTEAVALAEEKVREMVGVAMERGVRNALTILEKLHDAFLTDEVHRELVRTIRGGRTVADLKEGAPLWNMLHMTLFEVALPRHKDEHAEVPLKTLFSGMEQFYAGMQTVSNGKKPLYYSLEIAVADNSDEIIFYVAVPNTFVNLFEKQALSLFPNAVLIEQQNDYNIFVDGGVSLVSVLGEKKHPIHPLKTHDEFEKDPLAVILNAFSKIERNGGGAAVQIIIEGGASRYSHLYEGIVKRMEDGEKKDVAIRKSTLGGEFFEGVKAFFTEQKKKDEKEPPKPKEIDTESIELFKKKLLAPILSTNIRLIASAKTDARAEQILTELESTFHQFQDTRGNQLTMKRLKGSEREHELTAFSFREYLPSRTLPLSLRELATLIHFPAEGIESSPQFKQSRAKVAPAPINLPQYGTLLGENEFRNVKTPVYLTPEDRLRHFYVIGQTGTGKTTLLKNMIVQDIRDGAGVCMIDPHGTDIVDVLSAIPPERLDDLIYFDPSRMERVIGLNMLEFDPTHPEQKTFVVNELFSIFQKLYGGVPESMGPIFEQYFRNATLLVLEDPATGSTLLDISRVMADATYRRMKLAKAKNPVVVQFWSQIASKAGGEASLENIVPYITSKFDVFTANDYMRPIIGQQESSFNFRDIMDGKKILLVNLAKGRLGEINANLIGMIIVGKLLMAALSRVDDPSMGFAPFYLYIDEFQNVTTNSIAAILSEARKYKLGLTVAHQFIAQLDEAIKNAVFGNVGSIAAFRVGPEDATFLEHQYAPTFTASDLMNVENRNAYLRILAENTPTPPFSMRTMRPNERNTDYASELIEYSLMRYGRPREEVEAEIRARYRNS